MRGYAPLSYERKPFLFARILTAASVRPCFWANWAGESGGAGTLLCVFMGTYTVSD